MKTRRWSDRKRTISQSAVLLLCCAVAFGIHRLGSLDVLDDRVELAIDASGFLSLAAMALASVFATRHADRGRTRIVLTTLSVMALAVVATFTWLTYPDASIALADLVAPAAAADAETSLVLGPTGRDVRLNGDIGEGDADRLETILAAHPEASRIHLTSEGGLADEGQALGDVIAAHHLTTYVSDFCVSACTLAFVAGKERLVEEGARLGFHKPFYEGVLGQSFAGDASAQRAAYLAAGLSPDFVDRALKVAPDDAWFPDPDELLAAHVVTGIVSRDTLPDSMLDGAATRQGAHALLLRNFPALAAMDRAAPRAVQAIADAYLDGYKHGRSEERDTEDLKTMVRRAFDLAFLAADDATLLDLARYVSRAMQVVASSQPGVCTDIGETVDLVAADAILASKDSGADASGIKLVASALRGSRRPPDDSGTSALRSVALRSAPTCGSVRAFYDRILQRRDPTSLRSRLAMAARA